ncbi:Potassium channel KAT1, partial [Tetrabaena socialis]
MAQQQQEGSDAPPDAAETGRGKEKHEKKPRRSIFGLPLIQPYNLFAVLWTLWMLALDVVYTAFWVPMNVAFCTKQYGNLSAGCTVSDLVGGMMYFINCLLGFQGYDKSWMTSVSWVDVTTASPVYQWYCAVYWMIVTATTTGFGDFQPRSVAEQVVANVAMMGGMIMFGVLVASIGNALSRATAAAHQAYGSRRKIMHVMEWAEHRALPSDIRKQVQAHAGQGLSRMSLRACPSSHLRQTVVVVVVALVAENMRPLRLPAGEDLCQQGDVADCFWVLQEGSVQAVRYK